MRCHVPMVLLAALAWHAQLATISTIACSHKEMRLAHMATAVAIQTLLNDHVRLVLITEHNVRATLINMTVAFSLVITLELSLARRPGISHRHVVLAR
jgi:hypothetical protein